MYDVEYCYKYPSVESTDLVIRLLDSKTTYY